MREKRFTVGDKIRLTIPNATLTGITPEGRLTYSYPSELGTCEDAVELEGTAVEIEHRQDGGEDR